MATTASAVRFALPAEEPLKRIQSSLAARLEGSERALLQLCGISNFLAVETVRRRERACGRFLASARTAALLLDTFHNLGLACRIARYWIEELPDRVPGTHHNGALRFTECAGAMAVVLFALDASFLDGLEQAEIHREHQLLGRLFGYPPCCVERYLAGDPATADRTPQMIHTTGPFPALMNPAIQYLYRGLSPLFHFPCSAACEASQVLARHRLATLISIVPEAAELPALGRGISLYGETVGVALVTRYESTATNEFRCLEILSRDGKIIPYFEAAASNRLRLVDARQFVVGTQVMDDPHQFAALFE